MSNYQKWARVESLQGGKFVTIMRANVVEEAIILSDEEWMDWGESIRQWKELEYLSFGTSLHEPRGWETFYAHPDCEAAQLAGFTYNLGL